MSLPKPFFEHQRFKCGTIDEAKFVLGSVHLKQVCNNCDCYVKFFDKKLVPDIPEIKMRILGMTKDLELIKKAKENIVFAEGLTGLYGKVMYWKLYLEVRNVISKISAE